MPIRETHSYIGIGNSVVPLPICALYEVESKKSNACSRCFFLVTEMRFSPLRFSATVANSFPRSSSKQQTLPLLKKCQTHKTPFARWRIPTGVGITKKGENNLSYQLLKFPSVRHLPLTLPVYFSHWRNKKE